MLMPTQTGALDYYQIQRLAGVKVFSRGEEYYSSNRVEKVSESESTIHAIVQGNLPYSVMITLDAGSRLAHRCSCPQGDEGRFCKHCVATALAWMEPQSVSPTEPGSNPDKEPASTPQDEIQTFLEAQSKEDLVRLVQELAEGQAPVLDKLRRTIARAQGGGALLATLADELECAIRYPDDERRDWHDKYSDEVNEALDRISEILSPDNATLIAALCWKALPWLRNVSKDADHSDGTFGFIASDIRDLHVRACRLAPPDIHDLAVRIYRAELNDDWSVWHGWIEAHAGILKHEGLAVIRGLVDAALAKLAGSPKNVDERTDDYRYFLRRLDAIPEIAKEGLCFDGKELRAVEDFAEAARKCRDAGNRDRALDFALKGITAGGASLSLRVFLAEEYYYRGWTEKALAEASALFREHRSLCSYRDCKGILGTTLEWSQWRADEIAALKARRGEHSVLIEILLSEGLLDDAWDEAKQNGCTSEVWLELAGKLSQKHPEEVSNIYLHHAKAVMAEMGYGNHVYQIVVSNLVLAAAAARTAGIEEKFISEMNAFLAGYTSRRNLKKLVFVHRRELYGA